MVDLSVGSLKKPNWQTKEGWSDFVGEQLIEPDVMTRDELDALTEGERSRYCLRRLDFMANGRISLTAEVKAIRDELRLRMVANARKRGGKLGLIINGVPNAGKSTTVTRLAKEFEIQRRVRGNPRGQRSVIPVIYVSTPSDCTPKSLLVEFHHFLGRPTRPRMTAPELLNDLANVVERCGTELIIIDEIHNLNQNRQGASDATNYLKQLSEKCQATFVYVGANVEDTGLLDGGWAAQVATRFRIMDLDAHQLNNQRNRDRWCALLEDLETNAKWVSQKSGSILDDAELLWEASHGRVGEVAGIIELAVIEAMESESECLNFSRLRAAMDEERRRRARRQLDEEPGE